MKWAILSDLCWWCESSIRVKGLQKISQKKREELGCLNKVSRLERQKEGRRIWANTRGATGEDRGKHKVCAEAKSSLGWNGGSGLWGYMVQGGCVSRTRERGLASRPAAQKGCFASTLCQYIGKSHFEPRTLAIILSPTKQSCVSLPLGSAVSLSLQYLFPLYQPQHLLSIPSPQ